MILYIVLTLPWDILVTKNTACSKLAKWRSIVAVAFFATMVPLVYWFIQHKVHDRPGAYSIYAYFEWALIWLDIGFDLLAYFDFSNVVFQLDVAVDSLFFRIENEIEQELIKEIEQELEEELDEEILNEELLRATLSDSDEELLNDIELHSTLLDGYGKKYQCTLFVLNILNSFTFWTVLTALLCMVWHFPLWEMGISGYEAVIAAVLSPIFLYIPFMSSITQQYGMLFTVLFGVGSFVVESPEIRLLTCGAGVAWMAMSFVTGLLSLDPEHVADYAATWLLGLVLSVVIKFGWFSNNPLWPIMHAENGGHNLYGLIVLSVVAMLSSTLSQPTFILPSVGSFKCRAGTAVGFGSLLFAIHQLLTDSTSLMYWSYEQGMTPMDSAITIVVMLAACYLSATIEFGFMWLALLGAAGTLSVCYLEGWPGFILSLVYIVFIFSMVPIYFQKLHSHQSYGVFITGFLVYLVFVLASVWTVAYAFVPYGWILRERIEPVMLVSTLLILLGGKRIVSFPVSLGKVVTAITVILGLASYLYQQLIVDCAPEPYHGDSKLITAGIWTVHFGLDNDLWASEQRMIDLIRDMELDLVGLLETDTQRIVMGNRDLTFKMSHELNMYADYGPGPNKHTWGCVLLSKFPIVNSTHYLLPSPVGELAPAIHATVDAYGELVDVFVFHSGQEEDEEDRRLQSNFLSEKMGASNRPAILLSYLVTDPHEGNYNTYVSDVSGMHDVDPSDDDRWCEYILYKNLKRTGYARVSRGTITDTELQVAKFVVGEEFNYDNNRVDEVAEQMRFPDKFKGDGERGHFYHVFDEPRYFD